MVTTAARNIERMQLRYECEHAEQKRLPEFPFVHVCEENVVFWRMRRKEEGSRNEKAEWRMQRSDVRGQKADVRKRRRLDYRN